MYGAIACALPLVIAAASRADAPAKAPEVVTALPPMPLSSAQVAAIAAKALPQATARKPAPAPAPVKLAHAVLAPLPASAFGTSAAATAKRERLLHPQRVLPQISPALGVIPRPEWVDPFLAKGADITLIGGHQVPVAGTPAVAPTTVRR
jgi:hypothetical protein